MRKKTRLQKETRSLLSLPLPLLQAHSSVLMTKLKTGTKTKNAEDNIIVIEAYNVEKSAKKNTNSALIQKVIFDWKKKQIKKFEEKFASRDVYQTSWI